VDGAIGESGVDASVVITAGGLVAPVQRRIYVHIDMHAIPPPVVRHRCVRVQSGYVEAAVELAAGIVEKAVLLVVIALGERLGVRQPFIGEGDPGDVEGIGMGAFRIGSLDLGESDGVARAFAYWPSKN
jgi:hypothetical protein